MAIQLSLGKLIPLITTSSDDSGDESKQDELAEMQQQGIIVQIVDPIDASSLFRGRPFAVVISDGVHSTRAHLVGMDSHDLLEAGKVRQFAIIRIFDVIRTVSSGKATVVMIARVKVIRSNVSGLIGRPEYVDLDAKSTASRDSRGKSESKKRKRGSVDETHAVDGKVDDSLQSAMIGLPPLQTIEAISDPNLLSSQEWTICAKVTSKFPVSTWKNDRGSGTRLSVHLADDAGGQIKATMFKEAVELFQERFQENCYCVISGGVLKPADKKFSKLPNDFEMTLNASAQVRPVSLSRRDKSSASSSGTASKRRRLDDGGGSKTDQRQMQFGSFTPLRKLALIEAKTFVSVLGVIVHWSPLATLVNKTTGRETLKRQFSMLDKSKTLVSVNVWDKETTRLDETTLPLQSIVAIKNACVSDYGGGRSLDCSPVVAVNPEYLEQTARLRTWYLKPGGGKQLHAGDELGTLDADEVNRIQSKASRPAIGSSASASGESTLAKKAIVPSPSKTWRQVSDEKLGDDFSVKSKTNFCEIRGTVTAIQGNSDHPPWYLACGRKLRTGERCESKLYRDEADTSEMRCSKCGVSATTSTVGAPRYKLRVLVSDLTGSGWVTLWNHEAQQLLRMSANDLKELRDTEKHSEFDQVMRRPLYQKVVLQVTAKLDQPRRPRSVSTEGDEEGSASGSGSGSGSGSSSASTSAKAESKEKQHHATALSAAAAMARAAGVELPDSLMQDGQDVRTMSFAARHLMLPHGEIRSPAAVEVEELRLATVIQELRTLLRESDRQNKVKVTQGAF